MTAPADIIAAIQRLPLERQIDIMFEVAQGKDFGAVSYRLTNELDSVLQRVKNDVRDTIGAEQAMLHGHEVGYLTLVHNRDGGVWA